jgi:hypothetical protein
MKGSCRRARAPAHSGQILALFGNPIFDPWLSRRQAMALIKDSKRAQAARQSPQTFTQPYGNCAMAGIIMSMLERAPQGVDELEAVVYGTVNDQDQNRFKGINNSTKVKDRLEKRESTKSWKAGNWDAHVSVGLGLLLKEHLKSNEELAGFWTECEEFSSAFTTQQGQHWQPVRGVDKNSNTVYERDINDSQKINKLKSIPDLQNVELEMSGKRGDIAITLNALTELTDMVYTQGKWVLHCIIADPWYATAYAQFDTQKRRTAMRDADAVLQKVTAAGHGAIVGVAKPELLSTGTSTDKLVRAKYNHLAHWVYFPKDPTQTNIPGTRQEVWTWGRTYNLWTELAVYAPKYILEITV